MSPQEVLVLLTRAKCPTGSGSAPGDMLLAPSRDRRELNPSRSYWAASVVRDWASGVCLLSGGRAFTWIPQGNISQTDRELTYNSLTMIHVDESDPVGEMEPSFPYRDIVIKRGQDVKDLFLLQTEIGRGKFGTVYRCQEHSTGLQLAAKFVSTSRREDRRNVEREIDIMRALQHPRLIQLYDAFDNGKVMVLILEL
uniref:Protein kinase domain-containing protein n=2 Tax=Timema TaxID=61471 RepID=A0A7R9PKQ4_TIMGE|nr:unnamed protein product [Timema genevievae]